MNNSKGFFCLPEIKLKLNFPAALLELAKVRIVKREQRAVIVLGRRYGGQEAHAAGLVDKVCPPAQLRESAMAAGERLAGPGGLERRTLAALKRDLYRDVVQILSEPPRFYSRI
jgi:enoyl-CoA hydratase/carnithine racemase